MGTGRGRSCHGASSRARAVDAGRGMDELWSQVRALLGREVESTGQHHRLFLVCAVDEHSVTVQRPVTRRWREATGALTWEHVIPRKEFEAVAKLGLEREALTTGEVRKRRVIGPSLGYVIAILRALEGDTSPSYQG